ncbi:hypothetical protein V1508DRAFT_67601 [Lipomyces doorenjongii]|uniref:uncharacterized protein n=1 Tax=Lipomyces doorenjongii TaxID=383834 RepID=UPI0034CE3DC3
MKAGIRARETVRTLRQLDPGSSVTRRDIHNLRADIKRKELGGLSPIQALLFNLTRTGTISLSTNATRINGLFDYCSFTNHQLRCSSVSGISQRMSSFMPN